ncbi:MAG TPA: hypothetical protein VGH35_00510 [Gaiellaceae bacterium]
MILRAAALLAVLATFAPAPAGAGPGRPVAALTASPTHVTIVGRARHAIRVANPGATGVVVDASPAGFTLGPHGRPHVLGSTSARRVASWLRVRPSRIALMPGAVAELVLVAAPSRAATPGDHTALVLLTTRALPGVAVAVRLRVGITVVVHVPGRIVHRLALRSLGVLAAARRPVLRVVVANRGNVVEWLRRGRIEIELRVGRRRVAELRSGAREILPGSTAIFELPYRGRVRGRLTALVSVAGRRETLRRSYRVRL